MAQLIGIARIGRDAELRHTPQGDQVTNLSLAFSYGRKDQSGKRPTQWVDASLWGQRAERLAQYLLKGTLVYVVVDDAHIETYQTRDGGQGSKLSGRVATLEFAARPTEGAQGSGQAQRPAPRQSYAEASQASMRHQAPAEDGFGDMSDSIPF